MSTIDDGGSAFPTLDSNGHALVLREFGMSKREYIATQVLSGMCHGVTGRNGDAEWFAQFGAKTACQIADALISALKGGAA